MGKSQSRMPKRRSQSIAWSFRFPKSNKKMAPDIITPHLHLDIRPWLEAMDLIQYESNFEKFTGVEELIYMYEIDIKNLGVRNSAHRARIVTSLVALREKHKRGNVTGTANSSDGGSRNGSFRRNQRYSLAVEHTRRKIDEQQPTYELLTGARTKQSKSLGDLLEMDPTTENGQDALALKKALEWELSLDSRDLRSHAWYHGPIPRPRAEEIVQRDGDFLIRDCVSQPGNYVLTCKTKSAVLHFVINKILIQPETVYERVQYQFEDDAYDTVPDLITFYVGSGKAISMASGAKIQYPCNRIQPLSLYAAKYATQRGASPLNSPSLANAGIRYASFNQQNCNSYNSFRSPMSSPPRTKRETPPRLPTKKQRSQPLNPVQSQTGTLPERGGVERYCSSGDGVIYGNEMPHPVQGAVDGQRRSPPTEKCSSADGVIHKGAVPRANKDIGKSSSADGVCVSRQSDAKEAGSRPPSPPPKPNRISRLERSDGVAVVQRVTSYHASGSDSGNGSGDSAQSSAAGDQVDVISVVSQPGRGVIIRNPRFIPASASSVTLKPFSEIDPIAAELSLLAMDVQELSPQASCFDLENFQTLLLPSLENKPLDNGALNSFRIMLADTGPRIIANHLTRVDIHLILGNLDTANATPAGLLSCSGIELIALEHGRQFRSDLLERAECLKLLVAVTILTCADDTERAETLNKWIQVAIDTKTALGNLFGFCAIMLGLCMPQIQRLEATWHTLRQKYTDSAFNFEAKLRPTLKQMNDCSNPQAPNTTVPHLLPYILLRDRSLEDFLEPGVERANGQSALFTACVAPWETNAADFGLTILFAHLESARYFVKNLSQYKRNAQIVLEDSNSRLDELLEDAFKTEFHVKFLWGSKGALAAAEDRHTKLEQVLSLMAEKFCGGNPQHIISA